MSSYAEVKTNFNDGELLIKALETVGYNAENHIGAPINLIGYHGDMRKDKADIVVPRKQIGSASNDIGFRRQDDGTYKAIISDYDSTRHNKSWLDKVSVSYSELQVQKTAKSLGYRMVSNSGKKLANGNIKYAFIKA